MTAQADTAFMEHMAKTEVENWEAKLCCWGMGQCA